MKHVPDCKLVMELCLKVATSKLIDADFMLGHQNEDDAAGAEQLGQF